MITVKLTVNSIVDISRLCICILHLAPLPPNLFPIPNIIEHFGDKWGKFFLQSCAKCPVMEIYGLKLPISLGF